MARVGDRIPPMTRDQLDALKAMTPKTYEQRITEALERIADALEKKTKGPDDA